VRPTGSGGGTISTKEEEEYERLFRRISARRFVYHPCRLRPLVCGHGVYGGAPMSVAIAFATCAILAIACEIGHRLGF